MGGISLRRRKTKIKTEITKEDLSKAIQFLKDNSISSDEISLSRLIGWINNRNISRKLFDNINESDSNNPISKRIYFCSEFNNNE